MATKKTALGIDENIEALLTYSFGFVTGIVFLLLEKDSKVVRFHAIQSIIVTLAFVIVVNVIGFIPVLGLILAPILSIGGIVLWVLLMVKAYQGEKFKLPYVGDIAERESAK